MSTAHTRVTCIKDKFIETFGYEPQVVARAPGRVNLIGEHTDYNDGYVLPIAIDYDVLVAASPVSSPDVRLYSLDFKSKANFSTEDIARDDDNRWTNYIRGVASVLIGKGKDIGGADLALQGNVPLGSGLSSSAALEVATAMAFQGLYGFEMSGPDMAKACQEAEQTFAGVNCGIMDQFISRLGVKDHALFIDCRTLDYKPVPLPSEGIKVIVANTLVKHNLGNSEYNTRRAQCEEAVAILKQHMPNIKALRDVTITAMREYANELPGLVRMRAAHVVAENARVLESVEALNNGDVAQFGQLMNQSHDSLRDLYQVSCPELDLMVDVARKVPGVYGSRMTGGGFGGCTVSLVTDEGLYEFLDRVPREYEAQTGITPEIYVCTPESGAEILVG